MNYWLICLPREDIQHCIKVETFGLSRKNVISQVKQGDYVACCAAKGDWKIVALGEATSDYFLDDAAIFLKKGLFPDRFRFVAKSVKQEASVIEMLEQLSFVRDMNYWAVFFRNGIVKIAEKDWDLIKDKCQILVTQDL